MGFRLEALYLMLEPLSRLGVLFKLSDVKPHLKNMIDKVCKLNSISKTKFRGFLAESM
jgi:hypothetical protein